MITDVLQSHLGEARTVLEVGCGADPSRFASVGLDRDLAVAGAAALRVTCVVGDALHLPFGNECFDAVLARGVLHHVEEPGTMLREANRVLHRRGKLMVVEGTPMPSDEFIDMTRQLSGSGCPSEPRNGIAPQELRALGAQAGFTWVEASEVGRWTHATPPYTNREFSSTAWLCVLVPRESALDSLR